MTREEAIFILKEDVKNACWPMYQDALDMAISALNATNYETDTEVRLAVTDRHKDKVVLFDAFGEVEYLPTDKEPYTEDDYWNGKVKDTDLLSHEEAWAEIESDLISRTDAVKELKKAYWNKNIQSAKDDPCVIDAMTDWAIRTIKALPSADRPNDALDHDQEWIIGCIQHDGFIHTHRFDKANQIILDALADRPMGEWLQIDMDLSGFFYQGYYCSECNHVYKLKCNFCPNCGARMKGVNE